MLAGFTVHTDLSAKVPSANLSKQDYRQLELMKL